MAIIASVTSGKGGTGKTLVATTLARMLARKKRVLLVDGDVECPNDHVILGTGLEQKNLVETVEQIVPFLDEKECTGCGACERACRRNAIILGRDGKPHFLLDECNGCTACMIACPTGAIKKQKTTIGRVFFSRVEKNLDILSGVLEEGKEEATPIVRRLVQLVQEKKEEYGVVIVDTAPGTKCNVIASIEKADLVVVVVDPTPFGIHDASLSLSLARMLSRKAVIVENKAGTGSHERVEKLATMHDTRIVASIPYSTSLFTEYSRGLVHHIEELEPLAEMLLERTGQ